MPDPKKPGKKKVRGKWVWDPNTPEGKAAIAKASAKQQAGISLASAGKQFPGKMGVAALRAAVSKKADVK